ncbi:hypothetical protein RLEG12_07890 (plasmid) [Rhizobium leguminosarum bv. trifolii CB782]|nr:hypothetical protein RLEG12_07890 [Rhizobium leguminosarum bv. trifolii CB782]
MGDKHQPVDVLMVNLTDNMRGEFQGAFGELTENVNATMTNLRAFLGEVRVSVDTINGGAGEVRSACAIKRSDQAARRFVNSSDGTNGLAC